MGASNTISFARAATAGAIAGVLGGAAAAAWGLLCVHVGGAQRFEQLAPGALFSVSFVLCLTGGVVFHWLDRWARRPAIVFGVLALGVAGVASAFAMLLMPAGFGTVAHGAHFIVGLIAAVTIPWLSKQRDSH